MRNITEQTANGKARHAHPPLIGGGQGRPPVWEEDLRGKSVDWGFLLLVLLMIGVSIAVGAVLMARALH